MNLFELFGIEERPTADKAAITKKYFELQRQSHPDFFTQAAEDEREDALQQSAAINKGYKTFQSADKTLEYFLQVKNVISADEKYQLPPDFLMEMMDLNESFDDDEAAINDRVSAFENTLHAEVAPLLHPSRSADFNEQEMQQLKSYYYRKKYLNRILARTAD